MRRRKGTNERVMPVKRFCRCATKILCERGLEKDKDVTKGKEEHHVSRRLGLQEVVGDRRALDQFEQFARTRHSIEV